MRRAATGILRVMQEFMVRLTLLVPFMGGLLLMLAYKALRDGR